MSTLPNAPTREQKCHKLARIKRNFDASTFRGRAKSNTGAPWGNGNDLTVLSIDSIAGVSRSLSIQTHRTSSFVIYVDECCGIHFYYRFRSIVFLITKSNTRREIPRPSISITSSYLPIHCASARSTSFITA